MKTAGSISVCIPFYNAERFIERCAVSLFEQTYPDIEYIFVNDCADDMSVQILNAVCARYPGRSRDTKVINHNVNKGIAAARNTALEHCSGEFLLWVDSDDYIEKNAIELLLRTQRENGSDIVIFNAKMHSEHKCTSLCFSQGITKSDLLYGVLSRKYPPYLWIFMVRKKLYTDHNIKAIDGIDNGEDYFIIPRLLYYAVTVTHLNCFLYHYDNFRQDSLSGAFSFNRANREWEMTLLLEKFFSDKEPRYRKAVTIAKLSRLSSTIKNICSGYGSKQDFKKYCALKKGLPYKYLSGIPLRYRPLIIMNNYMLAKLYVRTLSCVKKRLVRLLEQIH